MIYFKFNPQPASVNPFQTEKWWFKMALAPRRAVTPLVVCLAVGTLVNNIGMAQSPVEGKSATPQIGAQIYNISLDPSRSSAGSQSRLLSLAQLKKTSLSTAVFIENLGQFDPSVRYQVKMGRQTAWLTADGVVFDVTRPLASEGVAATSAWRGAFSNPLGRLDPSSAFGREKSPPRTVERLVFTEDFVRAGSPKVEAKGRREGAYNYFQSRDPSKWHTNVRGYDEVVYRDVWPDIDLRIYGNGPDLEQEFVVHPGGDLNQVQISYRGIDGLTVATDGSLEVNTAFGTLRETQPRIYQQIAQRAVAVDGHFKLTSERSFAFDVGPHDRLYALVIDPTLLYSTFLGGSARYAISSPYPGGPYSEVAASIAVDGSGNAYVAGTTASTDFPTTIGAFQPSGGVSGSTGFITKLNATGSAPVYSTYLGWASYVSGIAVDSNGRAYVTGGTSDTYSGHHFPTTTNAFWPADTNHQCATWDIFMTELNPTGDQLLYSTCLNNGGGGPYALSNYAIAIDFLGRAYVAGYVTGVIPTTSNAYEPSYPNMTQGWGQAAFVTVFDTTASGAASLYYSTYLIAPVSAAGSYASGIAVDPFGKIYVTGGANPDFPVTPGAYQTIYPPCIPNGNLCQTSSASFIAKLDPTASGTQCLIYSTFFGGMGETAPSSIAVDASGAAYITGWTTGGYYGTFPTTAGAFQTSVPRDNTAFVTKFNASGSQLVYSTFVNGTTARGANASAITLDRLGDAYIVGNVSPESGTSFPVTPDAYQSTYSKPTCGTDCSDGFLTELDSTGSALVYSSYLGGSFGDDAATAVAVDPTGDVYVAGRTSSYDFPITSNAFQPAMNGTGDAFVTKFPLGASQALSISSIGPVSGGNTGTVSPQVFGTGFHAGATATLNCGQSAMPGSNLNVGPGGRFLNTTFDLTGAVPGKCDVVVANADGTSVTLSQAFTVQQGGAPSLQLYLTGAEVRKVPPEVQLGPASTVVLATISNTGSVDATGTFVSVPVNPPFSLTSVTPPAAADLATLTTESQILWNTCSLAAGQSQVFTSTAATSTSAYASMIAGPACILTPEGVRQFSLCMATSQDVISNCGPAVPLCTTAATTCPPVLCCPLAPNPFYNQPICTASFAGCLRNAARCAPTVQACLQQAQKLGCTSSTLTLIAPTDPNSLVGPPGVGGPRWTAGAQSLSYTISFQNEPTATAPAQQVVVTQPLGSSVNIATLSLLGMTLPNGSSNIQVPVPPGSFNPGAGVNEFVTNVDLRPTQGLFVAVDAILNPSTQTLTWTFTSIDPSTGLPPFNPLVGFLPPGAGANASFSVTPTPGLATGTQVAEQATVVFDGQSPMSTTVWTNTLDFNAPTSKVAALPAYMCLDFKVSWSGTDAGSGIQDYTIYISDNGGPFTPWLTNTPVGSATYQGQNGHTYAFYSIARDRVGNVEASKAAAEATTRVTKATTCGGPPSLAGSATVQSFSKKVLTLSLQVTNNGTEAANNIVITKVVPRVLSGAGAVSFTRPVLPISVGNLAAGASTTVTLVLSVPSTVTGMAIAENGTLQDALGKTYAYTIGEEVIP